MSDGMEKKTRMLSTEEKNQRMLEEFREGRLELLYKQMYPGLLMYAMQLGNGRLDFLAEDCVQDAIFAAWERRENFFSIYALKSFLYISVKNNLMSLERKEQARDRYVSEQEEEGACENGIIEQETYSLLYNAIHALPQREREVFELCVAEGMTAAEAAVRLGVSESTVKKTKARALEMLRGRLGPELLLMVLIWSR